MSNTIKKKLNVLKRPLVAEVLFDAVSMFQKEYVGIENNVAVEEILDIIKTLCSEYKRQLPKKQPAVKQVDIEDLIATIKTEQL
jgi:hypothetical protein